MANVAYTQPGPTEALPANEGTVPLAKFNTEAKQDLLITWTASPAKSGNQVAPTTGLVDESAGLPIPSSNLVKEKQCVLALTATMEILSLEAPSVVIGHQGATVEELAEEDLVEGCP